MDEADEGARFNDSSPRGNDFDVVVFNYALFDEDAARLLATVKPLLARDCSRTRLSLQDVDK